MQTESKIPKNRSEAKKAGAKFYCTGRPCANGVVGPRLSSCGQCWCDTCRGLRYAKARTEREKFRPYEEAYRARQKEKGIKRVASEKDAERKLRWSRDNNGAVNHRNALRRKAVIAATPKWADRAKIKQIYEKAAVLRAAGEDVHVDHIHPLQGDNFCGLHVHWNLQIIPAYENLSKQNKILDAQINGLQAVIRSDREQ